MAGGRRNTSSYSSSAVKQISDQESTKKSFLTNFKDGYSSTRHTPLPDIPRFSVLAFETVMCLLSILILGAHYLNIYRTVFWLPHSHTRYVINLYLIEPRVVVFILVCISRRLLWCLIKTAITTFFSSNFAKLAIPVARVVVVGLLAIALGYCLATIPNNLSYIKVISLAYPLVLYFFIFDFELTSFLEVIPIGVQTKDDPGGKGKIVTSRLVQHACLIGSEGVRNEAEFLSSYCSKLLTQVLYQTTVTVYYTALIPCFFVPNSLHYDAYWVSIHTIFVSITCFMWYLIYCYPARFCDIVHRNVQHLGSWVRLPNPTTNCIPSATPWSSSASYSRGSVVKHGRDFYRAEGASNAAEPGNCCHARLFMLFNEVWRVKRYFFLLSLFCSLLYLAFLATLRHWHQVLATGFLLSANYVTLYVLLRDYLVLRTTYHQEHLMGQ